MFIHKAEVAPELYKVTKKKSFLVSGSPRQLVQPRSQSFSPTSQVRTRGRRPQRERDKSNRFNWQNNNFARASRFFVHFFAVTARLRRENAKFHDVQRKYTSDDEISSLFLNLDMVLWNSTLGGFAYI